MNRSINIPSLCLINISHKKLANKTNPINLRRGISPVVGNFHPYFEIEGSTHGVWGVSLFIGLRKRFRPPLKKKLKNKSYKPSKIPVYRNKYDGVGVGSTQFPSKMKKGKYIKLSCNLLG